MIKHLKADLDEPERFIDDDHGRVYSRVVGGLAWPAKDKPGFLTVMGLDMEPDAQGHRHYWLLAEHESGDIGDLVRIAMDMRQEYQVRTWVGNVGNKPAMYLLGELMRDKDYKERLYLDMAPHAADTQGLMFYHTLIKECARGNRNLLHLGDSALIGYLSQTSNEDLSRAPEDFPAVAALGYALAELYGYQSVITSHGPISYSDSPGAWML
ncbi:MAG: hypothetical protein WC593_15105 [Methanoregula sp.]